MEEQLEETVRWAWCCAVGVIDGVLRNILGGRVCVWCVKSL